MSVEDNREASIELNHSHNDICDVCGDEDVNTVRLFIEVLEGSADICHRCLKYGKKLIEG